MEISLKVRIMRGDALLHIRRVRLCSPTYEVILRTVSGWVCGGFDVQWEDEEGDMITMDTEAEWGECVLMWQQRLQEDARGNAFQPLRLVVVLPAIERKTHSRRKCKASVVKTTEADPKHDAILSYLTKEHGEETLPSLIRGEISPADIGCSAWLTVQPSGGELNMDISQLRLGAALTSDALAVMDTDTAKAKYLFLLSMQICPERSSVALYNAACCDALSNNIEGAFALLQDALNHGYTVDDTTQNDADLMLLHDDPRWTALVGPPKQKKEKRPRCSTEDCNRKAARNNTLCKGCLRAAAEEEEEEAEEVPTVEAVVDNTEVVEEEEEVAPVEARAAFETPAEQLIEVSQEVELQEVLPFAEETAPEVVEEPQVVEEQVVEEEVVVEPLYSRQLQVLMDMGFEFSPERGQQLLVQCDGDLARVIAQIIE